MTLKDAMKSGRSNVKKVQKQWKTHGFAGCNEQQEF
jgi:hypothetical protein